MSRTNNIDTPEPGDIQIPTPSYVLPPDLCGRAPAILLQALPPPLDRGPEGTTARDAEAIEAVAFLRPGNVEETLLAVQFVVADAQANDVLGAPNKSPPYALKHWAAAASMMRQSRGALLRRHHENRALRRWRDLPLPRVSPPA
jgi:hypothetical protein